MRLNFTEIKALLFDNLNTRQTIFKNTFWISLSEGIGKFLRAFLIIYIARVLGGNRVMMGSWNLIIEIGWYNAALKIIESSQLK